VTTHKELLEQLIDRIRDEEVPFYRKGASANYVSWHLLVGISIVISAASSLIAALTPADNLKDVWIRGLLISLPIVGATVTAFLRSFSFHERESNREIGLIEAERLLRRAENMMASASTSEQYSDAYLKLSDLLAKLSHDQHARDVATRKGIQGVVPDQHGGGRGG